MFGQKQYNEYVELQELADNIWKLEGNACKYKKLQQDANNAYEAFEYAIGIKLEDY